MNANAAIRLTPEQQIFAVQQISRWLRIRAQYEKGRHNIGWGTLGIADQVRNAERDEQDARDQVAIFVLTQMAADVDHSALLRRLLSGRDPLPEPPPTDHAYPVYPDEGAPAPDLDDPVQRLLAEIEEYVVRFGAWPAAMGLELQKLAGETEEDRVDRSRMFIELAKAYLEFSIWVPKMITCALVIGLTLGAALIGLVWWLT